VMSESAAAQVEQRDAAALWWPWPRWLISQIIAPQFTAAGTQWC
jgi:hypothetical protein